VIIIVAILSIVFSFSVLYCTRAYLTGNRLSVGDTFFHLLIIKSIRKHHWKYPSSLENVTFDYDVKPYNYLAYPPLFHFIVALFPPRFYLTIAKLFNLVILSFLGTLAAIFVYSITSNLVLAMFSSFVITFNLSTFENAVMFTPRPLGLLFYSLVIYIGILCPQDLFSILVMGVLVMLINLTHKFATQAILFGLLPYVFIFDKLSFLSSIALGFLLSIFAGRGFYLKILKEHYNWLHYYSLYPHRTRITSKFRAIFSRSFWYLSIVVPIAFIFIFGKKDMLYNDLTAKVTFWALIPVLIALLVSIPALSFLGENYRYVQYGVVPVGIAIPLFIESSNIYIWLTFFVCLCMSFLAMFQFKRYLDFSNALVHPDDISSYCSLRNYSLSSLLVFPHIRALEVNYFTDLRVIQLVRPKSTWASKDVEDLLSKYGIQFVLKFKGDSQLFEKLKDVVQINKILVFTNFELCKLTPKNPNA
jgi:hypothetical protein